MSNAIDPSSTSTGAPLIKNNRRSNGAWASSSHETAIHPLVEAVPWDHFPAQVTLPLVDALQEPHKTTTFIDSATIAKTQAVLSSWFENLDADPNRPSWLPLQNLKRWTLVCLVLHTINRCDLLPDFINQSIEDTDLPLDVNKLKLFLKDNRTVKDFHKAQYKATLHDLDEDVTIYLENELLPFRTIRQLGSGGYAKVYCVQNVLRGIEIAHKVFNLASSRLEQRMQKTFRTEIQSLKRLRGHQHIVQYLGAYESPHCLGLLMRPVAECDLYQFLKKPQVYDFRDERELLLRCFGCLTSALAYMHGQQIRHKDVKPQNVLLERTPSGTNLLLTDFGIAMDFSTIAKSTTDGPLAQRTERYSAPEVANGMARGRRSDVYSLGCLFVEVATVMMGYDIPTLDKWLGGDSVFHDSEVETASWISKLQKEETGPTARMFTWIESMIRKRPSQRPQMHSIIDGLLEDTKTLKDLRKQLFCGTCTTELRKQKQISSTTTAPESLKDTQDSDSDYEDDNEEGLEYTAAVLENKARLDSSSYTSAPDLVPETVSESTQLETERIYVDISAIPRMQSGNALAVVHAYVSLVNCLQSYNIFAELPEFWSNLEYLRRRLEIEMFRLLNWGFVVGLSRGGPLQPSELESAKCQKAILNNFVQQQASFERCFNKLKIPLAVLHTHTTISRHAENFAGPFGEGRHVPAIAGYLLKTMFSSVIIQPAQSSPPSIQSNSSDPLVIIETLEELAEKNDQLRTLLDPATLGMLYEKDSETNLELLQLSQKLEDIMDLIRAVRPGRHIINGASDEDNMKLLLYRPDTSKTSVPSGLSTREGLAQFARFKALNTMIEVMGTSTTQRQRGYDRGTSMQLSANDITLFDEESQDDEVLVTGLYRTRDAQSSRKTTRPIWVEWKNLEYQNSGPDPKNVARIRKIALLLNDSDKPNEFYVPHCLGYFDDEEEGRIGLVFGMPSNIHANITIDPISLLEIMQSHPDIAVSTRLELALRISNCLLYLHSVNWLHKGLRSRSIIFFQDEAGKSILQNPLVCGFDYSRPEANDDMTERPTDNQYADVYRHPSVQHRGNRGGFSKTYDIYSLGIILAEIALWKPIWNIMQIDMKRARPKDTWKIKDRVLSEDCHREHISDSLGVEYWDVVKSCIEGETAFGLDENADVRRPIIAAALQAGFYRKVIRRLKYLVNGSSIPLRS